MYITVKSISDRKIPQAAEGISLARLARECFFNKQQLSIDFVDINTVTTEFCQELFFPLVTEFGAEFLNKNLFIKNLTEELNKFIHSSFANLDKYFDRLEQIYNQNCNREMFDLNFHWLIKARELCRDQSELAELSLGIIDNEIRNVISNLSMDDIQHISGCGWLCFTPRFTNNFCITLNSKQHTALELMLALSGVI